MDNATLAALVNKLVEERDAVRAERDRCRDRCRDMMEKHAGSMAIDRFKGEVQYYNGLLDGLNFAIRNLLTK